MITILRYNIYTKTEFKKGIDALVANMERGETVETHLYYTMCGMYLASRLGLVIAQPTPEWMNKQSDRYNELVKCK